MTARRGLRGCGRAGDTAVSSRRRCSSRGGEGRTFDVRVLCSTAAVHAAAYLSHLQEGESQLVDELVGREARAGGAHLVLVRDEDLVAERAGQEHAQEHEERQHGC